MAFTEFYMTSGGSQLNAGSTTGNNAVYTSVSGNWVQATRVFTPTDGVNPSLTVSVGDFASVFLNAAATGVYIGRVVTVVNAVNGAITIDATAIYGSAPANSTGGITLKTGGAWLGPNGATTFPFGLSGTIGALKNVAGDQVCLNVKNDQTYTMTAALALDTLGNAAMWGYTTNVRDGGKASFTSNVTTGNNFTVGNIAAAFVDLNWASTAASSTRDVFFTNSTNTQVFLRNVFHGGRGAGLESQGICLYAIECEAYDNNKANTASIAGFLVGGSARATMFFYRCYSHDNGGSNGNGFSSFSGSTGQSLILVDCIVDSNGGIGALLNNTAGISNGFVSINTNYYNNTSDAVKISASTTAPWTVYINNNFIKNGRGINNTVASSGGILYNNGRGAGTQANTSADVLQSIFDTGTDVTYASNVTPWTAPTTGNFSTILAAAIGTGRGNFVETDGTNTGTIGYPDIGAADAKPTGGLRLAGGGGLAA